MPLQVALTVVAEIKPGEVDSLRCLLATMDQDVANNPVLPGSRFPQLHFCRFLVLDAVTAPEGDTIPAQLCFLSDIDAPADAYLGELVNAGGSGIDQVFRHCVGYPGDDTPSPADRLRYLRSRMAPVGAAYVNTIGRSASQVRGEAHLRDAIQDFLDTSRDRLKQRDALAIRAEVQSFVRGDASLAWALKPAPGPGLVWQLKRYGGIAALAGVLLMLTPVLIFLVPLWLILIRLHEQWEPAELVRATPERARELGDREDWIVQNQFSAVGFVKPSRLRRFSAVIILWFAGFGIPRFFPKGVLTGVKTIHFARWLFLDDKRRLLFCSNYDGSLESYMDDFIDKVSWGLNAVFSNGVGYPRTRWLFFKGATDEMFFKHYLRANQLKTEFWYSAYPQLTAVNVENNAAIRAGLSGKMNSAQAADWLRRL